MEELDVLIIKPQKQRTNYHDRDHDTDDN